MNNVKAIHFKKRNGSRTWIFKENLLLLIKLKKDFVNLINL